MGVENFNRINEVENNVRTADKVEELNLSVQVKGKFLKNEWNLGELLDTMNRPKS